MLKKYDDPIKNTYCIKYVGVTDGKMGILSRKMPIPLKKREHQEEIEVPLQIEEKKVTVVETSQGRTLDNTHASEDSDDEAIPKVSKPEASELLDPCKV